MAVEEAKAEPVEEAAQDAAAEEQESAAEAEAMAAEELEGSPRRSPTAALAGAAWEAAVMVALALAVAVPQNAARRRNRK